MVTQQLSPELGKTRFTDNEIPGPLRNEVVMTIHTREAQKLIVGRRKRLNDPFDLDKKVVENIIGVYSFGKRMNAIWIASQYDDPYADWFLLQIEDALAEGKQVFVDKRQELTELFDAVNAIKITQASSIKPIEATISFANPYGYMGAYLVAEYDALVCALLTAVHIGLIDRDPKNSLTQAASKLIRRVFYLSTRWQFTGVSRRAVVTEEPAAVDAKAKMGDVPPEILNRSLRAKHAPEIRSVLDFVLPSTTGQPQAKSGNRESQTGSTPLVDTHIATLGQVKKPGNRVFGS